MDGMAFWKVPMLVGLLAFELVAIMFLIGLG